MSRRIFAHAVFVVLGSMSLLSACGSDSKAANEANFERALNAYYAQNPACLYVGSHADEDGYIFTAPVAERLVLSNGVTLTEKGFFEGLVSIGLASRGEFLKRISGTADAHLGKKTPVVGYRLTDKARDYLASEAQAKNLAHSKNSPVLCYGHREVTEITNFTDPAEFRGVKVSSVKYTYRLDDLAPWVTNPIFSNYYKRLGDNLDSPSIEGRDELILTNEGWVHRKAYSAVN